MLRVRNPVALALLPAAVCLLDVALTLHGQPAAYWQGDYSQANEGNPLPRLFLEAHPLAFVAGVVGWVVFCVTFLLVAPRRLAILAWQALLLGHTVGASSWLLLGWPGSGSWLALGVVVAVLGLAWLTWRAGWAAAERSP
jgi:hypothetical protein